VVFSFFKKDPKDAKKVTGARGRPAAAGSRPTGGTEVTTRPSAKPIGRPLDGPTSRIPGGGHGPDSIVPQRERARMTAAKIDEIEAQMARDLLGRPSRTTVPGGPATRPLTTLPGGPTTTAATTTTPAAEAPDPIEVNSAILAGNIDAIEISESGGGSVIDETAILFANGETDAAEAMLRAGLRRDDLGPATRMAWHMLFEIVNHRGDRAAFEQLTMDYALRFEHSPPAWIDYEEAPAARPVGAGAAAVRPAAEENGNVRLPAVIDADILGHLEKLRALTATHAGVQLDVSDSTQIDIGGAGMLLRVIGAFKRSDRDLTLAGAEVLAGALARSVESGRRDPSDALWMLLLELQRLLGRHEEFEETAIQYCITFEVSPPPWEPAPRNLKVAPATAAPAAPAAEAAAAGAPLELRGTVGGDGEPHLGRLITAARGQQRVVIDCQQLRLLSFAAGSGLLGAVRRIRQGGSTVELRNVSAVVAALLNLLGVAALAKLHQRYE
jgi:ABC-type transporter Mla MlaB component